MNQVEYASSMQKSRRNNDTLLQIIHLATIIEHSSIPRKNGGKVQIPVKEKPRSYENEDENTVNFSRTQAYYLS